jgi:hypothetical protein
VTVKPFFTRLAAMGNPMVPTPMKPIRVITLLPFRRAAGYASIPR